MNEIRTDAAARAGLGDPFARQIYVAPRLTVFGDARLLTQSAGCSSPNDGAMNACGTGVIMGMA